MNFDEFKKELIEKAKIINIELDEEKIKAFYDYMNLLIEKNKVINLTAIIEPREIILKHFIDSLTISKYIGDNDRIIDIGTGAGFPGIPLKIEKKNIDVFLLDSLNKRINFLNEVIEKLNINKIEAEHGRAEEAGQNLNNREQFDIAVSRAVAPLNILVEYLIPFVKLNGKCICMKGNNLGEEIENAKNAIRILGGEIEEIEELVLPGTDNKRTIIVIKKVKNTKKIYPRKAGEPAKHPL